MNEIIRRDIRSFNVCKNIQVPCAACAQEYTGTMCGVRAGIYRYHVRRARRNIQVPCAACAQEYTGTMCGVRAGNFFRRESFELHVMNYVNTLCLYACPDLCPHNFRTIM